VFQGESQVVFLELPGGTIFGFRQSTHVETDGLLPRVGQPVNLRLHPEHTVVVRRHAG
jgi:hypothetical protein